MRLETLLSHPAVQALGRSLLHFLWQGSLLALLLRILKTIVPASAARVRYAAASLIMLTMPVALLITVAQDFRNAPAVLMTPSPAPMAASDAPLETVLSAIATTAPGAGITGWVVFLWSFGVLLLSLRAAGGWMRAQRLRRDVLSAGANLQLVMTRLKHRLGISAPVRFYTSAMVEVPTVIGCLRPYLLLPVTTLTGLSEAQIESILAHELAHIRRHDYLVNLLQTAIETVLFYHPAVWWVGRQMRMEREHCCDDIAVAVCGNAVEYAGALAELEHLRGRVSEPALAATGGELLGRIRRLLGERPPEDLASRSVGTVVAAGLVLFIAIVPAMHSQSAAPQPAANPAPAQIATPKKVVPPGPPKVKLAQVPAGFQEDAGALNKDLDSISKDIDSISEEAAAMLSRLEAQEASSATQALLADQGLLVSQATAGMPLASDSPSNPHTVELLIKLYDSEKDMGMKRSILSFLADSSDPRASARLLSIYQSDSDLGMRRSALSFIAGRPTSFDTLVSLFDNEKDIGMKRSILSFIAGSSDSRASDKLFSIAQADPNIEFRRMALAFLAGRR